MYLICIRNIEEYVDISMYHYNVRSLHFMMVKCKICSLETIAHFVHMYLYLFKDCGSLPDPAFGKVNYSSTLFGSEAVYECNIGYNLQGLTSRKCEANRNWSGVTPTCIIVGKYT